MYPLTGNTRAELQRPDDWQVWGLGQPVGEAPSETRLRSLFGHLREAPEYRSARGIRHSLASVLAVTVVAKLVGYRGVTAIGEFAARLDQKQLRAVRAFLSPTSGRRYPPSRSSLHRILSDPDPEVLERAVQDWVAQTGGLDCALALDGKSAPAHRTHSGRVGSLPGCRRGARPRPSVRQWLRRQRDRRHPPTDRRTECGGAEADPGRPAQLPENRSIDRCQASRLRLGGQGQPAHRAGGPAGASMGRHERSRDRRQGPRPVAEAGVRCACSGRPLRGLRGVARPPPSLSHRARTNRAQDRQDHEGNGIRQRYTASLC